MTELVDDLTILHHDDMPKYARNHFYISCGICDLTSRLKGPKYEEVVFHTLNDKQRTNLHESKQNVAKHTINQYGLPVCCTIYPLSLCEWNATLLSTNRTTVLNIVEKYDSMQTQLQMEVEVLNKLLIDLNMSNRVVTPMLHQNLIHNRVNSQSKVRYNTLTDGCHPSVALLNKCKKSVNQAIIKNRKN